MSPCKHKYFCLTGVLNKIRVDTFSHIMTMFLLATHKCHSHICPFEDDNLKIKKRNIVAIGQKHTQHEINKYTSFCPIDTICNAITLHLPHTKFLSSTFCHFSMTKTPPKTHCKHKSLLHIVENPTQTLPHLILRKGHKG